MPHLVGVQGEPRPVHGTDEQFPVVSDLVAVAGGGPGRSLHQVMEDPGVVLHPVEVDAQVGRLAVLEEPDVDGASGRVWARL